MMIGQGIWPRSTARPVGSAGSRIRLTQSPNLRRASDPNEADPRSGSLATRSAPPAIATCRDLSHFGFSLPSADQHGPHRSILLSVDEELGAKARLCWSAQNSPIRPARSKSAASGRGASRRGEPARGRRGGLGADARRLHVHEDWTLAPDGNEPSLLHLTLHGLAA
jgi:hypothetical protein